MDSLMEEEMEDLELLLIVTLCSEWLNRRARRRWRFRPINTDRVVHGYFRRVFMRIKCGDEHQFFIHTRMTRPLYDMLLSLIRPYLEKPSQMISAEERLLYLAHGEPFQTIAWKYKIGKSTARNIILETCELIWMALSPIYLSEPTESQYRDIAIEFRRLWNIPNCVGAIDGKHIAIVCPKKSGSMFFNYKKMWF